MRKCTRIPRLVALVCFVVSIVALFTPYLGSTAEFAECLSSSPDLYTNGIRIRSGKEDILVSLSEAITGCLRAYEKGSFERGYYIGFILSPVVFAFLCALFSLLNNGILVSINSILMASSVWSLTYVIGIGFRLVYRGRVAGMSFFVYCALPLLFLVCGIWISIAKHKAKKKLKEISTVDNGFPKSVNN